MKIKKLGVMLDCSRDAVYSVSALKDFIDNLSLMGYNVLQLYTEDTYTIDDPHFGYLRGRYTEKELKEVDDYAFSKGIELIPCIQTLAHLGGYLRWKETLVDCADILLAENEQTYILIDKMFQALSKCYRSHRIHLGMDEAHMVGLGKYLDLHGYKNRYEILTKHLNKVIEIAQGYGFKPMIWSDMLFRLHNGGEYYSENPILPQEIVEQTPQNLDLVYWDYYALDKAKYDGMFRAHKKFPNHIVFAGGAWRWSGFVPQNAYSMKANEAALRSCIDNDIDEVVITMWGDDGAECSLYAVYPSLFYAAEMARGEFNHEKIKEKFNALFEVPFDEQMLLDEPDLLDRHVEHSNPCKYMLYSDIFLGIFDDSVDVEKAKIYEKLEEKLSAVAKGKYAYVYQTISALCGVMKYKYPLGVKTRTAYQAKDKKALSLLLSDYDKLENSVEEFYKKFRTQWEKECKPFGFEKQDVRIGGLLQRIKHCRYRLNAYLQGDIDNIPELEENILPCGNSKKGESITYNLWLTTAFMKPNS